MGQILVSYEPPGLNELDLQTSMQVSSVSIDSKAGSCLMQFSFAEKLQMSPEFILLERNSSIYIWLVYNTLNEHIALSAPWKKLAHINMFAVYITKNTKATHQQACTHF